jgi:hypothetical protein
MTATRNQDVFCGVKIMKFSSLVLVAALTIAPSFVLGQSSLERIATEILADRFDISLDKVLGVRRETREDVWDLGPVFSMSRYGNRDANEVQRLRASGMGWGQIAKKIGMHPGTFNKLRNQGYFDRDPFWDGVIRRRYSVRQDDINVIRKRGGKLEDVLGAIIIGKATNRSPNDVYSKYRTTKSWDRTARDYKFDLDRWESVGNRVGWEGASVPPGTPPVAVGPGKSQGKGNNKGKGHGQGHGKGGGKGKGKGGG